MSDISSNKKIRLQSDIVYVNTLVDRLKSGEYLVPKFQRPLVWKPHQVKDLLDSIYNMYPIGSVFIWETNQKMKSVGKLGELKIPSPVDGERYGYILDGQQRLTTLTLVLGSEIPKDKLNDHNNSFRIFFDLKTEQFVQLKVSQEPALHLFPVNNLVDTFGFLENCKKLMKEPYGKGPEYIMKAQYMAERMLRNYAMPVVTIGSRTLEEAVKIFSRLNRSGTKISDDQMVSALSYREGVNDNDGFDLSEVITEIVSDLEGKGFRDIGRNLILRAILGEMELDLYRTNWGDIHKWGADLQNSSARTKENLSKAVQFLRDEGITNEGLLPYTMQLVLISIFFKYYVHDNFEARSLLKRWFWVTSFTGWFAYGNATTIRWAINDLKEMAKGNGNDLTSINLNDPAKPLPENFNFKSGRCRVFGVFLASLNPREPVNDREIDPKKCLADGYKAFPYILKKSLAKSRYGSPENRILLGRDFYPSNFDPILKRGDVLFMGSHGITNDAVAALLSGDVETFLNKRRTFLIEEEIKFIKSKSVNPPVANDQASKAIEDFNDDD